MTASGQLLVMAVWVGLSCGYVDFLFPGNRDHDLTFNYIDIVYFTWTSSIDGPWMNLWCAPNPNEPQSKDYLYHEQVSTNGTNAQSFPYSGYEQKGLCHMQVESFSGDEWANTPTFDITSNDSVEPRTWGLDELGEVGGSPEPTSVQAIQALASIPSSVIAAATSLPSSSASSTSLSASTSSETTTSTSLTSSTSASKTQPSVLPEPSTSPQSGSSNTSLTPGAKAGISIGSIVAFLLAGLLLILAWHLKSRQQQRQRAKSRGKMQEKKRKIAELEEGKISTYELNGESMPNELQGRPKAELIGDTGALGE